MSVLDDFAARLVAQNVGTIGANLFIGSAAPIPIPGATDAYQGMGPYLTLGATGGIPPTRVMNKSTPNTRCPSVQVLVRAGRRAGVQEASPAALAMAMAAYAALDGIFNITVNGTFYLHVRAKQEPTDMGLDATGVRVQLVFNLDTEYAA